MRGYNVLRKGILSGARADFPYAEQFIIAEKDGKSVCLFAFSIRSKSRLTV